MTCSMTAFSRVQRKVGAHLLCWELKSVNHRYLEVSFRLPEPLRFFEAALRHALRNKLSRGKLDCQLKWTDLGEQDQSIAINHGLASTLFQAASKLSDAHNLTNDIAVSHLLSWPEVVQLNPPDIEGLGKSVEQSFLEALAQLQFERLKEGKTLKTHLLKRLKLLNTVIRQAQSQATSIGKQAYKKLQDRLRELELNVDQSRIDQEVALLLTKLDVTEELDRLQTHTEEVVNALETQEPVGRRLDFLMQELNREANTLSSKSSSINLTQHAVEMKVLIEQMREQIQNIE